MTRADIEARANEVIANSNNYYSYSLKLRDWVKSEELNRTYIKIAETRNTEMIKSNHYKEYEFGYLDNVTGEYHKGTKFDLFNRDSIRWIL